MELCAADRTSRHASDMLVAGECGKIKNVFDQCKS